MITAVITFFCFHNFIEWYSCNSKQFSFNVDCFFKKSYLCTLKQGYDLLFL